MKPSIAILGAGPSGLALGRFLELADIDYIIFERDEAETWSAGRGGTLDLHVVSGQAALKEAGLLEQFKSLARSDATNTISDANGKVYAISGEISDEGRPEIDRKDLRAMLLSSVPMNKLRWGMKVQRVVKDSDGPTSIHFTDGSIESGYRLVVGADGAWSKARKLITSLAGTGNYMAFGKGKQVAAQKLGDGSYYIVVGLRLPEHWRSENASLLENPSGLRETLLRDQLANWPQVHTDLVKHSEGNFHVWPLYAMPTESLSWESVPGVTLVGDAAHVTTPFAGEGVNCALYDSLQLAQQIVKFGLDGLDRAVSAYEQLMCPRAIDLIKRSEESGKLLFADDAPQGWLKAIAGIDTA